MDPNLTNISNYSSQVINYNLQPQFLDFQSFENEESNSSKSRDDIILYLVDKGIISADDWSLKTDVLLPRFDPVKLVAIPEVVHKVFYSKLASNGKQKNLQFINVLKLFNAYYLDYAYKNNISAPLKIVIAGSCATFCLWQWMETQLKNLWHENKLDEQFLPNAEPIPFNDIDIKFQVEGLDIQHLQNLFLGFQAILKKLQSLTFNANPLNLTILPNKSDQHSLFLSASFDLHFKDFSMPIDTVLESKQQVSHLFSMKYFKLQICFNEDSVPCGYEVVCDNLEREKGYQAILDNYLGAIRSDDAKIINGYGYVRALITKIYGCYPVQIVDGKNIETILFDTAKKEMAIKGFSVASSIDHYDKSLPENFSRKQALFLQSLFSEWESSELKKFRTDAKQYLFPFINTPKDISAFTRLFFNNTITFSQAYFLFETYAYIATLISQESSIYLEDGYKPSWLLCLPGNWTVIIPRTFSLCEATFSDTTFGDLDHLINSLKITEEELILESSKQKIAGKYSLTSARHLLNQPSNFLKKLGFLALCTLYIETKSQNALAELLYYMPSYIGKFHENQKNALINLLQNILHTQCQIQENEKIIVEIEKFRAFDNFSFIDWTKVIYALAPSHGLTFFEKHIENFTDSEKEKFINVLLKKDLPQAFQLIEKLIKQNNLTNSSLQTIIHKIQLAIVTNKVAFYEDAEKLYTVMLEHCDAKQDKSLNVSLAQIGQALFEKTKRLNLLEKINAFKLLDQVKIERKTEFWIHLASSCLKENWELSLQILKLAPSLASDFDKGKVLYKSLLDHFCDSEQVEIFKTFLTIIPATYYQTFINDINEKILNFYPEILKDHQIINVVKNNINTNELAHLKRRHISQLIDKGALELATKELIELIPKEFNQEFINLRIKLLQEFIKHPIEKHQLETILSLFKKEDYVAAGIGKETLAKEFLDILNQIDSTSPHYKVAFQFYMTEFETEIFAFSQDLWESFSNYLDKYIVSLHIEPSQDKGFKNLIERILPKFFEKFSGLSLHEKNLKLFNQAYLKGISFQVVSNVLIEKAFLEVIKEEEFDKELSNLCVSFLKNVQKSKNLFTQSQLVNLIRSYLKAVLKHKLYDNNVHAPIVLSLLTNVNKDDFQTLLLLEDIIEHIVTFKKINYQIVTPLVDWILAFPLSAKLVSYKVVYNHSDFFNCEIEQDNNYKAEDDLVMIKTSQIPYDKDRPLIISPNQYELFRRIKKGEKFVLSNEQFNNTLLVPLKNFKELTEINPFSVNVPDIEEDLEVYKKKFALLLSLLNYLLKKENDNNIEIIDRINSAITSSITVENVIAIFEKYVNNVNEKTFKKLFYYLQFIYFNKFFPETELHKLIVFWELLLKSLINIKDFNEEIIEHFLCQAHLGEENWQMLLLKIFTTINQKCVNKAIFSDDVIVKLVDVRDELLGYEQYNSKFIMSTTTLIERIIVHYYMDSKDYTNALEYFCIYLEANDDKLRFKETAKKLFDLVLDNYQMLDMTKESDFLALCELVDPKGVDLLFKIIPITIKAYNQTVELKTEFDNFKDEALKDIQKQTQLQTLKKTIDDIANANNVLLKIVIKFLLKIIDANIKPKELPKTQWQLLQNLYSYLPLAYIDTFEKLTKIINFYADNGIIPLKSKIDVILLFDREVTKNSDPDFVESISNQMELLISVNDPITIADTLAYYTFFLLTNYTFDKSIEKIALLLKKCKYAFVKDKNEFDFFKNSLSQVFAYLENNDNEKPSLKTLVDIFSITTLNHFFKYYYSFLELCLIGKLPKDKENEIFFFSCMLFEVISKHFSKELIARNPLIFTSFVTKWSFHSNYHYLLDKLIIYFLNNLKNANQIDFIKKILNSSPCFEHIIGASSALEYVKIFGFVFKEIDKIPSLDDKASYILSCLVAYENLRRYIIRSTYCKREIENRAQLNKDNKRTVEDFLELCFAQIAKQLPSYYDWSSGVNSVKIFAGVKNIVIHALKTKESKNIVIQFLESLVNSYDLLIQKKDRETIIRLESFITNAVVTIEDLMNIVPNPFNLLSLEEFKRIMEKFLTIFTSRKNEYTILGKELLKNIILTRLDQENNNQSIDWLNNVLNELEKN